MLERNQLQEFVDAPRETLDVEYKGWPDFSQAEAKASLARHICALANHGGGAVVFGVNDDMAYAGPNPFPAVKYDRDFVASIVKHYLEPTFQCGVESVISVMGNPHPVVVVPPHGAVPICAKAGGPEVDGKPKGIVRGVHYTRKPGPESAPIANGAEWFPIIRRCAMHERSAILGAIDAALRGASAVISEDDVTTKWHNAAHDQFLRDLAQYRPQDTLLKQSHWQLTYAIDRTGGQRLDPNQLLELLRQVSAEVQELVVTGWSMFHVFTRPEIVPVSVTDPASGQGTNDFLECAMLRDTRPVFFAPDMWRVAADGRATLIRPYWEDGSDFERSTGLKPGTWFSPNWLARSLAEGIRHARGLAERFESPTSITFRCEWHGLSKRFLYSPLSHWFRDYHAHDAHRLVMRSWPLGSLVTNWPDAVCELAAPVIRAFTSEWFMTPQWVTDQSRTWRR